jgi:predicted nuclease with RNAse H fold
MLKLKVKVIIGIDLAGKPENPTGWAFWENKRVETRLLYRDNQILEAITQDKPEIIAIDAPFSLPKSGILRKADREMIKKGYRVFPPMLSAMRTLTMRAIKLNKLIAEKGFKIIEVHPTSTCKALSIPPKDWGKIQTVLTQIGLEGDLKARTLTSHEIDAVIAALTACLYMRNQTEALGDKEEGCIIIPKKQDWRTLQI